MLLDAEGWCVYGRGRGGGVSECSGRVIFFLSKENCICAISRHHAESNINMLLTKNPLIDSGVTQ